jgi:hypothetical protein
MKDIETKNKPNLERFPSHLDKGMMKPHTITPRRLHLNTATIPTITMMINIPRNHLLSGSDNLQLISVRSSQLRRAIWVVSNKAMGSMRDMVPTIG